MDLDRIELRDLRAFVAVAEELHFGRAAERLHVSQPPLSQRIRRLEEAVGTQLLHRTTRRVWLTDAGQVLLDEGRELLAAAADTFGRLHRVARGELGRLRIGAVTPAMDGFLPGVVRSFRERHPGVSVQLAELDSSSQLDALRSDRLHIGFVRLADHATHGLASRLVHAEPYVLLLPVGHRLAERKRVPLSSLQGEALVGLSRDVQPQLRARLDSLLVEAQVDPARTQTAPTWHGVTALVAAGMGVALVPRSAATVGRKGVVSRPLHARLPPVEITAIWRETDTSAPLARFRELLFADRR